MNPGIFVMGGGGAGGGGSGKGGNGAGGAQGADGEGGGDGADGTGGNAGACGQGTTAAQGGCPGNHGGDSGQVAAGDPVDVVTGRVYTFPHRDVALPGPLPLTIVRTYNSGARDRDVGLGWGWTHSLAWTLRVRRRSVLVFRPDGSEVELPGLEVGETAIGPKGMLLRREPEGFTLETPSGVRRHFAPAEGVACALVAVSDRWGNRLTLERDGRGRLQSLTDSAGRKLKVGSDGQGRISSISVQNARQGGRWVDLMRYDYDAEGRLTEVRDAAGYRWHYAYDDSHRLVEHADPEGLRFRFRYDDDDRCVETWGEVRSDDGLADGLPTTLADGTPARGIHHCRLLFDDGYSEVANSLEVERYFGNALGSLDMAVQAAGAVDTREHDLLGHTTYHADPTGAEQYWTRDLQGRVTTHVDPRGGMTTLDRDADGHIRQITDPAGGLTVISRTDRELIWTNAGGASWRVRFDERGRPVEAVTPVGGQLRHDYDAEGNLVRVVDADGRETQMTYDGLGRLLYRRRGPHESHYRYDDRGLLVGQTEGGVTTTYRYDGARNLVGERRGTGGEATYHHGGAHRLVEVVRANGQRYRLRYDREGQLTTVQDGSGRTHRFRRGPRGAIHEETTFDGRVYGYQYDAAGRVTTRRLHGEVITTYDYDAGGRLIERVHHPSETTERFEHDENGHLIAAENEDGRFTFERNALGWIVAETAEVDGRRHRVDIDYDGLGNPTSRRSRIDGAPEASTTWRRSPQGRVVGLDLDGLNVEASERDLQLHLRAQQLHVETQLNPLGDATAVAVTGPRVSSRLSVARDELGRMLRRAFEGAATTEVERDDDGQLTAVTRGDQLQRYRYTQGDVSLDGPTPGQTTAYDASGRLVQWDDRAHTYDAHGRLETRRGPEGTQTFAWRDDGRLAEVRDDEGQIVSFRYDVLSRRVQKRVERMVDGVSTFVSETRFLYDGGQLVREIETRAREAGDPVIVDRRYELDDDEVPQFEGTRQGEQWRWRYIVSGDAGEPLALIEVATGVRTDVERTAWGQPQDSPTPLGFLGQYYDAETDLWCNRFRYYDGRSGRYISPDPKGLRGGPHPYAYANNAPFDAVDPDGLMPFSIIRRPDGSVVSTGENARYGDGVSASDAGHISSEASTSCAETAALHDMVGHLDPSERRAEVQRLFNEEGYTIETFDGNRGDYQHQNPNSVPMNPCPRCARMFNDLGIQDQVRAPNRRRGRTRTGSDPNFPREVRGTWNGSSTSH